MRLKHSGQPKASAERVVKDIRRVTRRHHPPLSRKLGKPVRTVRTERRQGHQTQADWYLSNDQLTLSRGEILADNYPTYAVTDKNNAVGRGNLVEFEMLLQRLNGVAKIEGFGEYSGLVSEIVDGISAISGLFATIEYHPPSDAAPNLLQLWSLSFDQPYRTYRRSKTIVFAGQVGTASFAFHW